MQNGTITLLIGAGIGLLSAMIIELFRYYLDKRKVKSDVEMQGKREKEGYLRDFLNPGESAKRYVAWLKLIDTPRLLPITINNKNNNGQPRQKPKLASLIKSLLVKKMRTEKQWDSTNTAPLSEEQIASMLHSQGEFHRKYLLVQTQILGRQKNCEIRLLDEYVSRLHALIRFENEHYTIYDLGSTSGTFVNKAKVGPSGIKLYDQDTIVIGESFFRFESTKMPSAHHNSDDNLETKNGIDAASEAKTTQLRSRKTSQERGQKP